MSLGGNTDNHKWYEWYDLSELNWGVNDGKGLLENWAWNPNNVIKFFSFKLKEVSNFKHFSFNAYEAVYKKFACYLLNYLLMFQFLISSSFHSSLNGLWLAITNHSFVMMMLDVNILFYFHAKIEWTILKLKLAS